MKYDPELEAAIDEVGRDKVFARMELFCWPRGSAPPKSFWWQVVAQLRQEAMLCTADDGETVH